MGIVSLFLATVVVTLCALLLVPAVQNMVVHRLAAYASEKVGAEVRIGHASIDPWGRIELEEVLIRDLRGDTLFMIGALQVDRPRILFARHTVKVAALGVQHMRFALDRPAGEAHTNFTDLLDRLSSGDTTSTGPDWTIQCNSFFIDDLHFSHHDHVYEQLPFGVDLDHVDAREVIVRGSGLKIIGDSIMAHLDQLSLRERSGFVVDRLGGTATVSALGISVEHMVVRTPNSDLRGELSMSTTGWDDHSDFIHKVMMRLSLDSSLLDLADVAYFAPDLEGISFPMRVKGRFRGTVEELKGRDMDLRFGSHSRFMGSAELSGLPDIDNTFMIVDVGRFSTDLQDLAQVPVPPFVEGRSLELPAELDRLGRMSFSGNFTGFTRSFTAYGTARTDLGEVRSDISYQRDTVSETFGFKGRLATTSFELGKLVGVDLLGPLGAKVRVDAKGHSLATLQADLDGEVPLFTIGGTPVRDIMVKGRLERNLFNGVLSVNDPNLSLEFKGLADLRGRWPLVDFTADLQHADLRALGLFERSQYDAISMQINASGRLSPDSLLGDLEIRDIVYCSTDGDHDLGDIRLESDRMDGQNILRLDASFAEAEIVGTFLPTLLPNAFANVVYSVFPALRDEVIYAQEVQRFRFDLKARDTGPWLQLFVPGLVVANNSTVVGSFDSRTFDLDLTLRSPLVSMGAVRSTEVEVIAEKTLDILAFGLSSERTAWNDSTWMEGISLQGKAYQDELEFSLGWDTSATGTRGSLELLGEVRGWRSVLLELLPSEIMLGKGSWVTQRVTRFSIDSTTVVVDSLVLLNGQQRIALGGTISKDVTRSMAFEVENVALANLEPYLGGPRLRGMISGDGSVHDLYGDPFALAYICADSIAVQDKPVGDIRFTAGWAPGARSLDLAGSLTRGPIKALDFEGTLGLFDGGELDVTLLFDRFDLAFINPYLPEGISEMQGLVSGDLGVHGTLLAPEVNGTLDLTDAGLRIDYLNTLYRFSHRLKVYPDMFALDRVRVRDEEGNVAIVNGTVIHQGLRHWNYNVGGTMERFLVLNTTLADNELFYGKAYGTGSLEVSGEEGSLDVVVDARTATGTSMHFPIGGSTEVSSIGFVQFVTTDTADVKDEEMDLAGISLDLKVTVTPEATLELIFDPTIGDILTGSGQGDLEINVNNAGDLSMRGQVEVTEGDYLFTLRNVVNKHFQLEPGGRITWYGDPFDAQLDLQATYRLRAPLYDIIPPSERSEAYKKRVPVEVGMRLREKMMNPEIGFQVRLPSVDESLRAQVNSALSTEQELNRQVFALIALNRFVPPPQYVGAGSVNANAAGTTTSELLSNQVSNWLSSLSKDVDLGVNYRPGDNITQDELELAVSTQLFNERLLFSSNVGVQYGAQRADAGSNLLGDFQLEYLMTRDGKFRLKAYSVSNDRNLNQADQAPTTQGVGVVFRREGDGFWELIRRKRNKTATP
jgi:hypothetical protein